MKDTIAIIYYEGLSGYEYCMEVSCHPKDTRRDIENHFKKYANTDLFKFIGHEIWKVEVE